MPLETSADPFRRSVVKIFTVLRRPNQFQPWDFAYQENSGGSGCILEGNRILTNAHVVTHQVYVQVLKAGDTRRYSAQVAFLDHDREAALLQVEDPAFFRDTVPVRFGELPRRRDKVAVCGFPMGGNELCITEGVVSRIEVLTYAHSLRDLLAVQTDAALNPGNSGGPVFMEKSCVGIAFQTQDPKKLQNVGYVVPVPILRDFLRDVEEGRGEGVPALGIFWQKTESESLRQYFRLGPGQTGLLVTRVLHGSSADGVLQEKDVITAIDGVPVDCDGSIPLREDDRVNFSYLVSRKQVGQSLEVSLVRDGKPLTLTVQLGMSRPLVPRPRYLRPAYFVFAGLVFLTLSYEFMSAWDWEKVDVRYRYLFRSGLPSVERREVVIISQVLAHDINVGYHQMRGLIVDKVNGRSIGQLTDVPVALQTPLGDFHVVEVSNHGDAETTGFGTHIVLRADQAERATAEILARYGIPSDRHLPPEKA